MLYTWKKHVPLIEIGYHESLIQEAFQNSSETVFPPKEAVFKAFALTPFESVKVVILGQDPYHQPHQAHGLAFSVPDSIKPPPSLRNIFKELNANLYQNKSIKHSTDLSRWATQGVLLLNTVLTVQANQPGSHRHLGWQKLTDDIISSLSNKKKHLVFILWGKDAQEKNGLIDAKKHLILESPHPSPLAAFRGFFGSKPFSKSNSYLESNGQKPIVW